MATPRGEHIVLAAGLLVIVFAVYQAPNGHSDPLPWFGGIALVVLGLFRYQLRHLKFGPGGVQMAVSGVLQGEPVTSPDAKEVKEQLSKPTQPGDLKLLISTAIPVGMAQTIMGTQDAIQVTAVNTSATPLGVNSLGLSLSDGRYIPVDETMPTAGNTRLPAVLNPQQTASVWLDHESTRNTLAKEGVRLDAILAHVADGTTRREPVPDDWRRLGEEGRAG